MPILSDKARIDELILWEVEQRYNRIEATIIGVAAAGTQNWVIGQILKTASSNYTAAVAGDTTGVHAVLLEDITLVDDATVKAPIMVRGPAILNHDKLVSPATANLAAQKTAIAALGMIAVKEPVKITTAP